MVRHGLECLLIELLEGHVLSAFVADQKHASMLQHGHLFNLAFLLRFTFPLTGLRLLAASGQAAL